MSEAQCNWSRHYLADTEGNSNYAASEVWARAAALSSWRRDGAPFNRYDLFRYSRSFRHELQFYGQLAAIPEIDEHAPGRWFANLLNMRCMVRWKVSEIEHGAHSFLVHWTNGAAKEIEYRAVGFVPDWNLYGELRNTHELTRRVAYSATKYEAVGNQLHSLLAE